MIRSVLPLRVAAGAAGALEDFYAEHRILARARAFAGCRDAVLLRPIASTSAPYLVIADWGRVEDYERWVAEPWRAALSQQLAQLLDAAATEPLVGGLFEFVPAPYPPSPTTPEEHQ